MPTVGDYLRAASLLEDAGAQARRLVSPVRAAMGPGVLIGGALSRSTESTIAERTGDAHRLGSQLLALASECQMRAAAVTTAAAEAAAFEEATAQYNVRRDDHEHRVALHESDRLYPHPGPAPRGPVAPPSPPSWADF